LFRLLDSKDDLERLSSHNNGNVPVAYRDIVERKARELQTLYEFRLKSDERGVAIEVMGSSARRLLSMSRREAEGELRRALTEHIREQVTTAVMAEASKEVLKNDLTISLSELTDRWKTFRSGVSMSNDLLGGGTPMRATLEAITERFNRERLAHPNASCTLFLVSDGDSTDGDSRPPAEIMGKAGVKIVSRFVSQQNVVEPRRLYAKLDRAWPDGAEAMFDIASLLPVPGPEAEYLDRIGWQATPRGRMFAQINQSDLLSEFMNVVIAPIEAEHGGNMKH
jgi:hypothetical protein